MVGNPDIFTDLDKDGEVFIDGGVLDNFPIQTFDSEHYVDRKVDGEIIVAHDGRKPVYYNKSTLAFRVDSSSEISINNGNKAKREEGFLKYSLSIVNGLHEAANRRHLDDYDWHRTMTINTQDISATDFNLSKESQAQLINQGRKAAETYLKDYKNTWLNHP